MQEVTLRRLIELTNEARSLIHDEQVAVERATDGTVRPVDDLMAIGRLRDSYNRAITILDDIEPS